MVRTGTGVATKEFSSFFAHSAKLHVFVLLVNLLIFGAVHFAVGTRPLALGRFVEFRIETAQMVRTRTCVAKDDFAALLANLAVLLMFALVVGERLLLLSLLLILVADLHLSLGLWFLFLDEFNFFLVGLNLQHFFKFGVRIQIGFLFLFFVGAATSE